MESHKDPDNAEKNWVQPNSTSRPTSGLALRSTLRLTLTLSGNNNNNVYQYNTIYMTLTLRPTTSETNMESCKDPNNADIKCATLALSLTLRPTSGFEIDLETDLEYDFQSQRHLVQKQGTIV
jgi:hypothetical protein